MADFEVYLPPQSTPWMSSEGLAVEEIRAAYEALSEGIDDVSTTMDEVLNEVGPPPNWQPKEETK